MTPREALADYLLIRRRVGFKLEGDQRLLENFVAFLEQARAERITTELALAWAQPARRCAAAPVASAAGDRARIRPLPRDA